MRLIFASDIDKLLGFHNFDIDLHCTCILLFFNRCRNWRFLIVSEQLWDCVLAGYEETGDSGDQQLLCPTSHPATDAGEVKIVDNYSKRGLKRKVLSGINFRHENYCLASSPWHSGQSRSRGWGWKMSEIFKKKAKHKMSTRTKRWKPKLSEFLTICSSLPSSKYL